MSNETFTVVLPIILSLVCYCFIIYATKTTTSYVSDSSFLPRHLSKKTTTVIYLAFTILSLLASIYVLYLHPHLFKHRISNVWLNFSIISLFTGFFILFYYFLLKKDKSLDSMRYPGHHYRRKGISTKFFARLFCPVNSIWHVIILFSLLVIIPYAVRGAIIFLFGQRIPTSYQTEPFFSLLILSVLLAPIYEEILFRWLPYNLFGVRVLIIGSVLWLILHPIYRFQMGMNWVQIWPSIPFWFLDVFFYIKLWQGKYYWTAFIFHSLTNLIIISASTFLGIQ